MVARPETLRARVQEALHAGVATAELTKLYFECYGQSCYQRPRLEHYLRQYLGLSTEGVPARPTGNPPTPTTVAYKFKDAFKDVSAIVHTAAGPKEVHAGNLTADDAEYLIANNQGHLLEKATAAEAKAYAEAARPELSTRTNGSDVQLAPDKVVAMVDNPNAGVNDAREHDAAEQQARQKQADQQAQVDEQPDLTVAVVDAPAEGEKPKPAKAPKAAKTE